MEYTSQVLVEAFLKRSLTASEIVSLSGFDMVVKNYIDSIVLGSFGVVAESTRYYNGGSNVLDIEGCTNISAVKQVDSDETVLYEYDIDTELESMPRNKDIKRWIEKRYDRFPKGLRNIGVTAKFSLGALPDAVQQIATMMVSTLLTEGVTGNVISESIEGYSRTFANSASSGGLSGRKEVIDAVLSLYLEDEAPII